MNFWKGLCLVLGSISLIILISFGLALIALKIRGLI